MPRLFCCQVRLSFSLFFVPFFVGTLDATPLPFSPPGLTQLGLQQLGLTLHGLGKTGLPHPFFRRESGSPSPQDRAAPTLLSLAGDTSPAPAAGQAPLFSAHLPALNSSGTAADPSGLLNSTAAPIPDEPEYSVVQIFNEYVDPTWDLPWRTSMVQRASGSGFLISGDRIMTNAHVVANASRLLVRRYHDPRNYTATVEFVGQDVDLAILKVTDPSFYVGLHPLSFGGLPPVRSSVVTYGFPAGGQQISYTKGVVSRIEVQKYVHIGNRAFLACQTDAAINPGNSGGPVVQDDKVVGVAFESVSGLENTGYFIPTVLVKHFLADIASGSYQGIPYSGLHLATLQNRSLRRMLGLPEGSDRGVRVDSIEEIPTTRAVLKPNDVILQIGDFPVDEDGTITFENNTVGVKVAFDLAQDGQSIPLKILRGGQPLDLSLVAKAYHGDQDQGYQYDTRPPYVFYGGLVFTALSLDYLRELGSNTPPAMIYELFYRHDEDPKHWRPQPVVLSTILSAPVNADFSVNGQVLVDKINGIRIDRLSDVPTAFAAAKGPISVLEFLPDDHHEYIRNDDAIKATRSLLGSYNIPSDHHF